MKTKDELNALKGELEELSRKLAELNEEELEQVIGGLGSLPPIKPDEKYVMTAGISPNDSVDFGQDFDNKQDTKQYEFHVYDTNPDKKFF